MAWIEMLYLKDGNWIYYLFIVSIGYTGRIKYVFII